MKVYYFHYWLILVSICGFPLAYLFYIEGMNFMSIISFVCGLLLLLYSLAYIELSDETLIIKWRPYKKLVLRTIYLKDISSVNALKVWPFTTYFFPFHNGAASHTNWPAIGWPGAYQVGLETKNGIALVADIVQRIPGLELDEMTKENISKYTGTNN